VTKDEVEGSFRFGTSSEFLPKYVFA